MWKGTCAWVREGWHWYEGEGGGPRHASNVYVVEEGHLRLWQVALLDLGEEPYEIGHMERELLVERMATYKVEHDGGGHLTSVRVRLMGEGVGDG